MYEGSQASLADMAAKQANGVKRIDSLRAGLLETLKRNYPGMYVEHEKRLGKPLATLSDEALLAYLSAFLNQPPPSSAVRTAISASTAASSVDSPTVQHPGTPPNHPDKTSDQGTSYLDRIRTFAAREGVSLPEGDAEAEREVISALRERKQARESEDDDWAFLSEYVPPEPAEEEEIDWNVLFEDEPTGDSSTPLENAGQLDTTGNDSAVDHGVSSEVELDVDDLFDDGESHDWGLIADLEAEPSEDKQKEPERAQQLNTDSETFSSDVAQSPTGAQNRTTETATAQPDAPNETSVAAVGAESETGSRPSNAAARSGQESQLQLPGAVRPEIVAQPPRPKSRRSAAAGRKALRVAAVKESEVPAGEAAQSATSGSPDESQAVVNRMLAGPIPVFGSDISAALGSTEAYHEWEDQNRSLGQKSPVRFITPKPRHRQRGLLVLPVENGPSEGPWRDCLDSSQLRGARLYELAVVLHQVGTGARSVDIQDATVTVRAALATGMTGLVMCANSTSGKDVAAQVEELLRERLSGIIILTTSSDANAVEDISDTVREALKAADVKVTTPVVAARSWSWAQNPTSTVVSVAG